MSTSPLPSAIPSRSLLMRGRRDAALIGFSTHDRPSPEGAQQPPRATLVRAIWGARPQNACLPNA
eukprot:5532513-Alexandrium_andersonii.AAC.1